MNRNANEHFFQYSHPGRVETVINYCYFAHDLFRPTFKSLKVDQNCKFPVAQCAVGQAAPRVFGKVLNNFLRGLLPSVAPP